MAHASGTTTLGAVVTGPAFGAASHNAALRLCLGCEAHLLARRALSATSQESATKEVPHEP
ncbi:hypothetical protein GCM10023317_30400 [Actinopolymorpha pittospori]